MSEADRKPISEMSDDEFDEALESADAGELDKFDRELKEEHVRRYGIDRRLVRTDSAKAAELREMDTITLHPEGHEPLELEYDAALQLLVDAAPLVREMAEERARFTVPDFCPMCERHGGTPIPPREIARDWRAVKDWLLDEFDIQITRKEAEHHYSEHIYRRNITPVKSIAGDEPSVDLMLTNGKVVEVPMDDRSPAARLEAMVEEAEDTIDEAHLLDREPTDVEVDVVRAVEFGERYTVTELAEASGRTRRSIYNKIDDLVESRVLHPLGTSPAEYEATGLCLYKDLEAPSPETGEQSSLRDWMFETSSLEEYL